MFYFDFLGYLFILEILSVTKAFKFEKSAVLSQCPAFWYNENTKLVMTSKTQLVIGGGTFQFYMLLVAATVQPYVMMVARLVPEIIDPVFAKTSQNARFLLCENERFGLVFVKTGSINSGIVQP
jgi:hypothetical protein